MSDTTLIVESAQPHQKFNHNGSIIFKCPVPDGVQAIAENGGILLEQGGGNKVMLFAKGGQNNYTHLSGNGNTAYTNYGTVGSMSIIGGRVFIDGKEVNGGFNQNAAKDALSGITVNGNLGDLAVIASDGSATVKNIGNNAIVGTKGSFTAGNIGEKAAIDVKGSLTAGDISQAAKVTVGGSLRANALGNNGKYTVGGSTYVTTVIGADSFVTTGGTINAGYADNNAQLDAGGSIYLADVKQNVIANAGGTVKIRGHVVPKLFGFKS